jgi:CheY-like chemotaxis protein
MAELVDASRRSLRRLGVETALEADVPEGLPLVADRERMERALTAMVLRARALGDGAVRLEARRHGGRVQLRVLWQGEALGPEDRATAFDARWEAPQAQRQGLGMALLVAREAATLHGGTLEAERSAFVLELPLRASPLERDRTAGAGRVLVVDDDEPIARMMAEFLAESGYDADWAGGGLAAREKVKLKPPQLMVLDLRMPDLDGRGLLTALRALGFGPRVVLLSADREVAAAARELGCDGFVEKPFAPEGLLAAVRRALPGTK